MPELIRMNIGLNNVGCRFNKEWIFKNINHTFNDAQKYAVLGPNGSGKSTFLGIILGTLSPSEGEITYTHTNKKIQVEQIYQYLSFAAPYIDLIEEFSLQETIDFHFKFKSFAEGLNSKLMIELLSFKNAKDKPLKYFSSGMKQRTKLALACCAASPILVLDEPTSNLDNQGVDWYLKLIEKFAKDKMIFVGSNQEHEFGFCENILQITDYK